MPRRKKSNKGWAIVFRYLARYKKDITIYSSLGVISAISNGTIPLIFGVFFDAILNGQTFSFQGIQLPLWAVLLVLGALVQVVADIVDWNNDVRSRKISTYIATEYPSEALGKMVRMPITVHKEYKGGSMWSKNFRARIYLVQIIENVVLDLAPQILSIGVGLIVAFYIHPILALIIALGVTVYVLTLLKIVPPIVKLQKKGEHAWNKAYGYAYDTISNIQPVKHSNAEEYESKRILRQYVGKVAKIWFGVEKIWGGIAFYQRILITTTRMILFVFSVLFIQEGALTIGELIALNGYAAMVFGPFVRLGYNWQTIQNGLVAIEQGEKLLNTPPENYEPKGALDTKNIRGAVDFRNVTFTYGKNEEKVLRNITLDIKPGEKVALVGESGVGKSTLVDLVSGYYMPQKGQVLIDGKNLRNLNLKELREQIAVVPQEVVLFNDTIETNIKYGSFKSSKKDVVKAVSGAHADEFIDKFAKKYKQLVGERGVKLSVGQKQRVAIARAILRNPRILILDEPTSALDVATEKKITESLEKLMEGRTTIIIAHRLSTVRKADRIFVFDKGRLVEQGHHSDLIKKKAGVYKKLYDLHIDLE